jgi:hypothetical protein
VSFRDDGAAALEWAASYLERVHELPVLAQVEPGEIRRALPEAPPEVGEPFSAVLRDLDEVLLPGITLKASGEAFLSHTALDGRYVLRLAIGSARTTEDVRRAWDVLRKEL